MNRVRCEPELFPGDCEAIFEQALESMRQAGAELVECDIPYTGLEGGILSQATLLYEFQAALTPIWLTMPPASAAGWQISLPTTKPMPISHFDMDRIF